MLPLSLESEKLPQSPSTRGVPNPTAALKNKENTLQSLKEPKEEVGCCGFITTCLNRLLECLMSLFFSKDQPPVKIEDHIKDGCLEIDGKSEAEYDEILKHLNQVKELKIAFTSEEDGERVLEILDKLPNLHKLTVGTVPNDFKEDFFEKLSNCKSLRYLELGLEPAGPQMIEAIGKLKQLEGLDLFYVQEVNDFHLTALSKNLNHLKYLNVGRNVEREAKTDKITGTGVLALVKANPSLEVLILSHRKGISEGDHWSIATTLGDSLKFIGLDEGTQLFTATLKKYLVKPHLEGASLYNQPEALRSSVIKLIKEKKLSYVDISRADDIGFNENFVDFYKTFNKEGWQLGFVCFGCPKLQLDEKEMARALDEKRISYSSDNYKTPYSENWKEFEYFGSREGNWMRIHKNGSVTCNQRDSWEADAQALVRTHQWHHYLKNYSNQFKEAKDGTSST